MGNKKLNEIISNNDLAKKDIYDTLWVNPSNPIVAFPTQTINLSHNVSNYNYFIIEFISEVGDVTWRICKIARTTLDGIISPTIFCTTSGSGLTLRRSIQQGSTNSQLKISGGDRVAPWDSNHTWVLDDGGLIPYVIYGIK